MSSRTVLMAHPSTELYGSDRTFLESAIALRDAGWRVVVTLPASGPLADRLEVEGIRVTCCPTAVVRKAALRPGGFLRLVRDALRTVRPMWTLLREVDPDLVYVNTVIAPLWMVMARLRGGARVLAHVHEAEDGVPRIVQAALLAPLCVAHTVLVNSQATASATAAPIPTLRRRIRLVYNGVAGPGVDPAPRTQPADPARIVLVGRLSPRKGTDIAVRAVALLHAAGKPVRLDLVGSVFTGYEWYERQLREEIDRAGLADSVRFHGFHPDVWDSYRLADVVVVPSRCEPFGNTSVEAQLAGVPVIVSDAQGLPETVHDGLCGTVVPTGSAPALADAISAVLGDYPAAVRRAEQARSQACRSFAPARYRAEIAEIAEIAGDGPLSRTSADQ